MIKAEVLSHRSDHNTKQMRCCVRDKYYVHGLIIEELNMLTKNIDDGDNGDDDDDDNNSNDKGHDGYWQPSTDSVIKK